MNLSFSYVLTWVRKTPNGRIRRATWPPERAVTIGVDGAGCAALFMNHYPVGQWVWEVTHADALAMDWEVV